MSARIWILGAPDPEMHAIESLLRECGECVAYAVFRGERVTPATAYHADCTWHDPADPGDQCQSVFWHNE